MLHELWDWEVIQVGWWEQALFLTPWKLSVVLSNPLGGPSPGLEYFADTHLVISTLVLEQSFHNLQVSALSMLPFFGVLFPMNSNYLSLLGHSASSLTQLISLWAPLPAFLAQIRPFSGTF